MSSSYVDAGTSALEHLESMSTLHPDLSEQYTHLTSLYQRKLWHQLTSSLLDFVSSPKSTLRTTAEGTNSYLALYDKVVLSIDKKLNQLSLARIASRVSFSLLDEAGGKSDDADDGEAARAVLENLLTHKDRLGVAASVYTESKLGLLGLTVLQRASERGSAVSDETTQKTLESTKDMLSKNRPILSELADAGSQEGGGAGLATVHAAFYRTAMTYRKAVGPPEAYYREAIQYLAYAPLNDMATEEKYNLATDLSLASLTGEGVFNLGRVVHHPLLSCLEGTANGWLVDLMKAGADGSVTDFNAITEQHADDVAAQPALSSRAVQVREKITLLALVRMLFERDSHDRTVSFEEISKQIQMPADKVEWVVMRALSLGLIKGSMDQVDGTVDVTWVMPRVLSTEQMADLAKRFGEWAVKSSKTREYMAEQTSALVN